MTKTSIYSFEKITTQKSTLRPWWIHHYHVRKWRYGLGSWWIHYGLLGWPQPSSIDPSWWTTTLINWPRLLSNFDVVLEDYYHFIATMLITTTLVNELWPLSSVESSNLHKFVQFWTFSLNWNSCTSTVQN